MEVFDRPSRTSRTPDSIRNLGTAGYDNLPQTRAAAEGDQMPQRLAQDVGSLASHLTEGPEHTDVRTFWNAAHGVQPDGSPALDLRTLPPQGEN